MRVGEVMTQGVETTTAETTLQAAALRMREAGVGMLAILEGRRPIGVITDRDITVRATANGLDPTKSHVRDVMTSHVFCCFEDDSIEEAARLMQEHTVRRILVVDRDKRMVGIITLDDLSSLSREERAGPVVD